MNLSPSKLVGSYIEIASLPAVFRHLNKAISQPNISTAQIARIISDDPGLCARLLRLANSAFYGFPTRIDSISQAIILIGTQQVRDLAMATSVITMFRNIPEELVDMESFWKHSIACGVAGRALAAQRGELSTERFFLGGILHDIGRLVLFSKQPNVCVDLLVRAHEEKQPLYRLETERFGFDHAAVGGELIRRWNLPACLEEVVAFHHYPSGALRYPLECAAVHVADILVHTAEIGKNGQPQVPALSPKAGDLLELDPARIAENLEQIEIQTFEVVRAMLFDESGVLLV